MRKGSYPGRFHFSGTKLNGSSFALFTAIVFRKISRGIFTLTVVGVTASNMSRLKISPPHHTCAAFINKFIVAHDLQRPKICHRFPCSETKIDVFVKIGRGHKNLDGQQVYRSFIFTGGSLCGGSGFIRDSSSVSGLACRTYG